MLGKFNNEELKVFFFEAYFYLLLEMFHSFVYNLKNASKSNRNGAGSMWLFKCDNLKREGYTPKKKHGGAFKGAWSKVGRGKKWSFSPFVSHHHDYDLRQSTFIVAVCSKSKHYGAWNKNMESLTLCGAELSRMWQLMKALFADLNNQNTKRKINKRLRKFVYIIFPTPFIAGMIRCFFLV